MMMNCSELTGDSDDGVKVLMAHRKREISVSV